MSSVASGRVASAAGPESRFGLWALAVRGLRHHARMHAVVALGMLVGTAILAGALVVGDSIRGSLRAMTLERLGRIDEAVVQPTFFRRALAAETASRLRADPASPADPVASAAQDGPAVAPALLLSGSVSAPDRKRLSTGVALVAAESDFFAQFGMTDEERAWPWPGEREVVINRALAEELGVTEGDEVIVRLPAREEVPADSALGQKSDLVGRTPQLVVRKIVPDRGLGRFSLRPNQVAPRNVFLALPTLQRAVFTRPNQRSTPGPPPDRVNALLVGGVTGPDDAARAARLAAALRPTLDDYGLKLRQTDLGYLVLESDGVLFSAEMDRAVTTAWAPHRPRPVLTYLAEELLVGERRIPYATVAGIDTATPLPAGPLLDSDGQPIGPLAEDQIVLHADAADDLQAKVGDRVRLVYFLPESSHLELERRTVELTVKAVARFEGAAADRDLTPTLPGITDSQSIRDWQAPFPDFHHDWIRDRDEAYWDAHRATPRGFVSLDVARKLWTSRFGQTTSWQVASGPGVSLARLETELTAALEPARFGFVARSVKREGLAASSGTTPFDGLFLAFSMFLMAAAVLLVVLLFRLATERRAAEIGVLLATGWTLRQVRRLLLAEASVVALVGAAAGTLVGVGYGWGLLVGLRTWWLDAVRTPQLTLHATPWSLGLGFGLGVLLALGAVVWALRGLGRVSVRTLITEQGGVLESRRADSSPRARTIRRGLVALALLAALVLGGWAARGAGEAQAGAFFGSAALVLTALVTWLADRLRSGRRRAVVAVGRAGLMRLAWANAARNPARSTMTMALVASAAFLLVAISAFRLEPSDAWRRRDSGTGGFALMGETDVPVHVDLNSPDAADELPLSSDGAERLQAARTFAFRVRSGDDASCLNLYQTMQPRVLGVPAALLEAPRFAWAATAPPATDAERANPWTLLERELPRLPDGREVTPVVIDGATATYGLHLSGIGARYEMDDGRGGRLAFQVVGLLRNSVLQGALVVDGRRFTRLFPEVTGYRLFLIEAQEADVEPLRTTLIDALEDQGLSIETTAARLADLLAVQNTYLSTFQALGGLGLLLGTVGLAVVQLRNVLDRRGELALLGATGFSRGLLARMVVWENVVLLGGGLVVGVAAALVAVLPHSLAGGTEPPWARLAGLLAMILAIGLLAGLAAVRAVVALPLVASLRGD